MPGFAPTGGLPVGGQPVQPKVIFLKTSGNFPRPPDWNPLNNSIECLGGGAGQGNTGAGGASYAKVVNQAIGLNEPYTVGAGGLPGANLSSPGLAGGDTWFGNAVYASARVGAKGGGPGPVGGQASGCIGSTVFSGGGQAGDGSSSGAAGPNGVGLRGSNGGSFSGGAGDNGLGGAGGTGGFGLAQNGGPGGNGQEWTQTSDGSKAGSGGGGGVGASGAFVGGAGGLYGAGPGQSFAQTPTQSGAPGIIVVTYVPLPYNTIILTTTGTIPRPTDWNDNANTIECIGAGASGPNSYAISGDGGGYAKITNYTFAGTQPFTIGQPGPAGTLNTTGDTWFGAATFAAAAVGARGGPYGQANQIANGIGSVLFHGGSGVSFGAGGAAGPNGNGLDGPNNPSTFPGGAGDAGLGGLGGAGGYNTGPASPGLAGTEMAGGIGAGGGGGVGGVGFAAGGGGLYGGGGSGSTIGGLGASGVIILTYAPIPTTTLATFLQMFFP